MASEKQLKANRENALKGGLKIEARSCPLTLIRQGATVRLNAVSEIARENVNNKFCGTNPISAQI